MQLSASDAINMDSSSVPGEKKLMETAESSAPNKEELAVKRVPLWGSCRLVYTICAFVTMLNLILMRFNLSFALVCMVRGTDTAPANNSSNVSISSSCASMPPSPSNITEQRVPQGELDWDKFLQGRVLSAFFYGYVMTQGFGGWFSDRFGGKLLYIMGNLLQSVTTLLIPLSARFHPEALFGVRVLQGLVAGLSLPSVFQLYSQWAAPSERTALIGAAYAGFPFGNIIIFPLCAFICQESDWSGIFYLTGAFGLVCSFSFFFLVYDNPDSHPRITEEERLYLKAVCVHSSPSKSQKLVVPWRAICVSPAVYAFHIAHFCYYWGFIILAVNLPTFMKEVLHFDLTQNGLLSALPYVGMLAVRVLISTCFARVLRWSGLSLTRLRKINHTIGSLVAAVTILLVAFLDCSQQYLAVALLTIGQGVSDLCFTGSYLMSYLDMAPRYAGLLTGISNTMGSLSGVLAPTLVGILTPHGTREEWTSVLYVTCGFYFVGAITYLMFGSSELQPWAETGIPSMELNKLNT